MNEKRSKTNYGGKALLPLLLFLVMYVGCGVFFTIVGAPEGVRPFNVMPRYVPMMIAIIAALFFYERKAPFSEKLAIYSEGAGRPGGVWWSCWLVVSPAQMQPSAARNPSSTSASPSSPARCSSLASL